MKKRKFITGLPTATTSIKTVAQAKKAIKEQHDVDIVTSILKGFKYFLEDTEEEGNNQSNGTHFKSASELIEMANDICN